MPNFHKVTREIVSSLEQVINTHKYYHLASKNCFYFILKFILLGILHEKGPYCHISNSLFDNFHWDHFALPLLHGKIG